MTAHRLPPLASLRAFEAVARRASFKAAAAELAVTPTAISHQIRQLESWLGVRVLDRSPRAVKLTAAGQVLFEATASSFAQIGEAVQRLRQARSTLTLSSTTAFLSHWLVPRLGELRLLLPDVDLRLHGSDDVVELRPGVFDVAVRYGKGALAATGTVLASDRFVAVCSPALGLTHPDGLRRARLIHIDGLAAPMPPPDWRRWLALSGVSGVDADAGVRFSDSLHALQAAIAGQGVALISAVLASDALAAGLLVAPFSESLPGNTYIFVSAPGLDDRADVAALRAWFRRAMAREPPGRPGRGADPSAGV